jgi:hypothetical protein
MLRESTYSVLLLGLALRIALCNGHTELRVPYVETAARVRPSANFEERRRLIAYGRIDPCERRPVMSSQELMTLYSDVVVDLRAESDSRALVELEQCACTVRLGDVMEILSDDPAMSTAVCGWAERSGCQYLGTIEEPGFSRVFVRRTR